MPSKYVVRCVNRYGQRYMAVYVPDEHHEIVTGSSTKELVAEVKAILEAVQAYEEEPDIRITSAEQYCRCCKQKALCAYVDRHGNMQPGEFLCEACAERIVKKFRDPRTWQR